MNYLYYSCFLIFYNNFNPFVSEVKSNSRNIKYHNYLIAGEAFSTTPLEIINSYSYRFSSILLVGIIIIEAVFSFFYLLAKLYRDDGGIHNTERSNLSAIFILSVTANFDFVI
jgi:hypothetical protein